MTDIIPPNEPNDLVPLEEKKATKKVGRPTKEMVAARKLEELQREKEFPELADMRMKKLWHRLADRLEVNVDKIAPAAGFIALGILTDKLRDRAVPTSVHNTQVVFNGYSREDAMALLKGKKVKQADRALCTDSGPSETVSIANCKVDSQISVKDVKTGALLSDRKDEVNKEACDNLSTVQSLPAKELDASGS